MKNSKALLVLLLLMSLLLAACGSTAVEGNLAQDSENSYYEPLPDEAYEAVEYSLYPAPENAYVGDVMPFVTDDGTL